jgi:GTP-binding protein
MAGEFLVTIGDISNLKGMFTGPFMKGRRELRLAFVGRSNVGKSTLINTLLEARVAQVSKEPGKTRSIHFYYWKELKKIVADLPGYGFAKTAQTERDRWAEFINAYLRQDEALERAVVLLDARHGPTDLDIEAIKFLASESVPITFVFSKLDTVKTQSERASRKKEGGAALLALGYDPKHAFWVSAKDKTGLKELTNELGKAAPPTEARLKR